MLKITNLDKFYVTGSNRLHALKNVNLDFPEQVFWALAGPSGSGKTTLLNCIGAMDNFDNGDIELEGYSIKSLRPKQLTALRCQKIGFIFQSYNLLPVLRSWENVAIPLQLLGYSRREQKEMSYEILEKVGLKGMEDKLPSKLSGGQQQRVAIARCLVKKPKLVLADEPTANLDSETATEILDLLYQLYKSYGSSVIFSTHDPMVMQKAERVIKLHDGSVQV